MEPLISRIDHVSIAVRDYEKAERFFRTILGGIPGAASEDPGMKYVWQILSLGDLSRVELMRPTGKGSFLDNFLSEREGGVHHISIQTPDIEKTRRVLEQNSIPYFGYNSYYDCYWKELFIHPRDAFGVLIQIAEFNAPDWLNQEVNLKGEKRWGIKKTDGGIRIDLAHPGGGRLALDLTRDEVSDLIVDLQRNL